MHRDPIESVRKMKLEAGEPEGGKGGKGGTGTASTRLKPRKGIEGITMAELSSKWSGVVEALKGDGVKVINPDHALEGALCIRLDGYACAMLPTDCTDATGPRVPLHIIRAAEGRCVNLTAGSTYGRLGRRVPRYILIEYFRAFFRLRAFQ